MESFMKATVADELEFDSWPEEQKELARRVLYERFRIRELKTLVDSYRGRDNF
jgi:hypothetical protein